MKTPAIKEINDLHAQLEAAQANAAVLKDALFTKLERYARDLKGSPVLAAPKAAPVAHAGANGNGNGTGNGHAKPKAIKAKTGKVAIRYQDPKRPENTWSGRGRPARWLAMAEKQGHKREEYLVRA